MNRGHNRMLPLLFHWPVTSLAGLDATAERAGIVLQLREKMLR